MGKIKQWLSSTPGFFIACVAILTLMVEIFDLLDRGSTKSVKIVETPPLQVKIDDRQLDKLTKIIEDRQKITTEYTQNQPIEAIIPTSNKRTALLGNMGSIMIDRANTNISVVFKNVLGKNFAKLTIAPIGKTPTSLPIYNSGQYLKFKSKTGIYIATVLNIDFSNKKIEVDVSKEN